MTRCGGTAGSSRRREALRFLGSKSRSSAASAMPSGRRKSAYRVSARSTPRKGSPRFSTSRTTEKTMPARYNAKPASVSSARRTSAAAGSAAFSSRARSRSGCLQVSVSYRLRGGTLSVLQRGLATLDEEADALVLDRHRCGSDRLSPLRMSGATPDVSWLTSMCERMLDGERGWVDIFETTPPVPTLLYMPGVLLACMAGVSSEAAVFATAYATALLALYCTLRLLPGRIAGSVPSPWAVVFLPQSSCSSFRTTHLRNGSISPPRSRYRCLPRSFAARKRASGRRGEGGSWPPQWRALPSPSNRPCSRSLVALAVFELARTRSLAFLFPSMLPVAAVAGLAFTVASLAAFPAYLDGVTTLMRDVYVPIQLAPYHAVVRERGFVATALCTVVVIVALFVSRAAQACLR